MSVTVLLVLTNKWCKHVDKIQGKQNMLQSVKAEIGRSSCNDVMGILYNCIKKESYKYIHT